MTDDILDTINGALRDWETSDDAMRWVPQDERTDENRPSEPFDPENLNELFSRVWASYQPRWHHMAQAAVGVVDVEDPAAPQLAELDGVTIVPLEMPPLMPMPERGQQIRIFDRNGEQITFTIGDVRVTADGTVTIIPEAAQ